MIIGVGSEAKMGAPGTLMIAGTEAGVETPFDNTQAMRQTAANIIIKLSATDRLIAEAAACIVRWRTRQMKCYPKPTFGNPG